MDQESMEELSWWNTEMIKWNGKALLRKEINLTITSDASQMGWGAMSDQQRTGGPWSQKERTMHINCLELLAATLSLKTFAKGKQGISILLYVDNTTAVAYINNLGGMVSKELLVLTRNLWMWCLERNIQITAQHLLGKENQIADEESWAARDQ